MVAERVSSGCPQIPVCLPSLHDDAKLNGLTSLSFLFRFFAWAERLRALSWSPMLQSRVEYLTLEIDLSRCCVCDSALGKIRYADRHFGQETSKEQVDVGLRVLFGSELLCACRCLQGRLTSSEEDHTKRGTFQK